MGKEVALLSSDNEEELAILNSDKLYVASKIVDTILAQTIKNTIDREIPEVFFYVLMVLRQRSSELLETIDINDLKTILED